MTDLKVREGDRDAKRTGYWMVTGPQPERDMYAIVERTLTLLDDGGSRVGYAWYLHERTQSTFNSVATYMRTVGRGEGATLEEALEQLRAVWPLPGQAAAPAPAPSADRLQRLWER